mmetsp:Transcript_70157/g.131168  ORF Transcript_70157/g.131168 Transcript_70157/m.131168 type:complete len:443 (+) Transcript_70157:68-1396(+)
MRANPEEGVALEPPAASSTTPSTNKEKRNRRKQGAAKGAGKPSAGQASVGQSPLQIKSGLQAAYPVGMTQQQFLPQPMTIAYMDADKYGEFEEAPYEAGQILSQKLTEYGSSRGGATPKGTPETVQLAGNLTDATSGSRRQGSAATSAPLGVPPGVPSLGASAGMGIPQIPAGNPAGADQTAVLAGLLHPAPLLNPMNPMVDPLMLSYQYQQLLLQGSAGLPPAAAGALNPLWGLGSGLNASSPWPPAPGLGVPVPTPGTAHGEQPSRKGRDYNSGNTGNKEMPELAETDKTTIMLKGIPCNLTPQKVQTLLNERGYVGRYDFLYVPYDCERKAGPGYAFVNFVTHDDARKARLSVKEGGLQGFNYWQVVGSTSKKVCEVPWAENGNQGLDRNIERYRNSPLMHEDAPPELKERRPMLFSNGERIDFPKPTKPPPRWKPKSF